MTDNENENQKPRMNARHYQAAAGLALAGMFLLQLQRGSPQLLNGYVVNALMLFVGTVGLLYRIRLSPLVTLLALAAQQIREQIYLNRELDPDFRAAPVLDLANVLLCLATVTYVVCYYRLHGIWFGVVQNESVNGKKGELTPEQSRSESSLQPLELVALGFTVPTAAIMAEFAVFFLKRQWTLIDMPPRWVQFLFLTWALLLTLFLARHVFRGWRRAVMNRVTALVLMHDIAWNETKNDQRRIQRWMIWKRLQQKK